jgi:stage V sporulation protein AD
MAPACADTLLRYFSLSNLGPTDFDLILSGDLGKLGQEITMELCRKSGLDLEDRYTDCGLMIYDMEKQEVNAGGSGCGCSACVFSAYISKLIKKGIYKNVLLIGTGALLSPSTVMQKESIPGVAHLVRLEKGELNYV